MKHALVVLAALILGMSTAAYADPDPALSGPLPSLLRARQWLNTQPLRPEDLRGKVILVNFWTYSCINSLRALPYVREWARKYRDRGLVVIGVQTPEFVFEKDVANVSKALVALEVDYFPSPSTTTTGFGGRSITKRGRGSTSSAQMAKYATTCSARVVTTNRNA